MWEWGFRGRERGEDIAGLTLQEHLEGVTEREQILSSLLPTHFFPPHFEIVSAMLDCLNGDVPLTVTISWCK